jgi:hypothetical protein
MHRSASYSLRANFESADAGFQRRDPTYVGCPCAALFLHLCLVISQQPFSFVAVYCVSAAVSSQQSAVSFTDCSSWNEGGQRCCFSSARNLGFICLLLLAVLSRQVTLMVVVVMMIMMTMMMASFYL